MVGSKLGNYLILEKVGEGGAGEVFKARDLLLGRIVAIKAVREDFAFQPQVLERFRTEARTLARLNHPHIATLHSLHEEEGRQLMVMEFVDGRTFAHLVRAHGALPVDVAVPLVQQALDGIGHAHEHGVVHRDLKSSNLMVTALGVVKIMDFGIARALGSGRVTRHGHMVGTLQFVAPEQVQGLESDARSDVYSLAVVLFHLLTGRLPFEGTTDYELMRAHVETPPPRPSELGHAIAPALEDALLRGLAKAPDERWPGAHEFAAALAEASGIPAAAQPLPLPAWLGSEGAADDPATPATGEAATALVARAELPTREAATRARARLDPDPARARTRLWQRIGAGLALFALGLGIDLLLATPDPAPPIAPDRPPASAPILLNPGVETWPEPLEPASAGGSAAQAARPGSEAGASGSATAGRRRPPKPAEPPSAGTVLRRDREAPVRPTPARRSREGDPGWIIRR